MKSSFRTQKVPNIQNAWRRLRCFSPETKTHEWKDDDNENL